MSRIYYRSARAAIVCFGKFLPLPGESACTAALALSQFQILWWGKLPLVNVMDGNCQRGGNFPELSCPGGKFCWWEFSKKELSCEGF